LLVVWGTASGRRLGGWIGQDTVVYRPTVSLTIHRHHGLDL